MATATGAVTAPQRRWRESALLDWLTTSDHKKIGLLYMASALFFFLVGGVEAMLLRIQLTRANLQIISPELYNQLFTMHGTTMIFLMAMPILAGFGNYFVPLMIGARDMAFPKINALGYWLFLFGGIFINLGFLFNQAPNAGWYNYANQTELAYSPGLNEDFWALGINILGIASLASSVNLVVTILKLRCPGMTINRMPIFCWTMLVQAALILGAIPSLTTGSIEIYLDRHIGTSFYQISGGGDPILWQHEFWFFGHPEVYIVILPVFGVISEVLPGLLSQAALRLHVRGLVHRGDRLSLLRRLGPPHVCGRDAPAGRRLLRFRQHDHRHPDGGEDLQLDWHALGWGLALHHGPALRGRLHR